MRCIGHGGVPTPATDPKEPIPWPGVWEERGSFVNGDKRWNDFGFACSTSTDPPGRALRPGRASAR
jgi:hypothetical protein